MTHDRYIEWIHLAVLGELAGEDRRRLDEHLGVCTSCRESYEQLEHIMALVREARPPRPTDAMVAAARENLERTLAREILDGAAEAGTAEARDVGIGVERPGPSPWRRLLGVVTAGSDRPAVGSGAVGRLALAGTAAVAVGFLAGYLAFGRHDIRPVAPGAVVTETMAPTAQELGPPSYANVRFVDVDPRNEKVRLEYDMVRPVRLEGNIEDERVQRILAHTVLNEKNPGVKLRAIQTIDTYVDHPEDEEVKKALIQALKTDPSPGVRKHALYVLYKMPFDQAIKEACLFVLANDDNPGMRIAAINILAVATLEGHVAGKEVYDVLAEEAGEDDYLRIRQGAFSQEVTDNGSQVR